MEQYKNLISLLRFFAETKRFNVIDRIAFAMSPESVVEAIYEAERIAKAMEARRIKVKISFKDKSWEVDCCEYEEIESEAECYGVCGMVEDVKESPPGVGVRKGAKIACVPCPRMPGEEELRSLLELLKNNPLEGMDLAKRIATLSLTWRG